MGPEHVPQSGLDPDLGPEHVPSSLVQIAGRVRSPCQRNTKIVKRITVGLHSGTCSAPISTKTLKIMGKFVLWPDCGMCWMLRTHIHTHKQTSKLFPRHAKRAQVTQRATKSAFHAIPKTCKGSASDANSDKICLPSYSQDMQRGRELRK